MLEMLFFYDGNLSDVASFDIGRDEIIDAGDGYTSNMTKFMELLSDNKLHNIITNQVELLDNKWLWDTRTHKPRLCLRDAGDGKWKPVGRFTKKDIKNSHSLKRMFMKGEFTKRARKGTAERIPRDLLRFRIE